MRVADTQTSHREITVEVNVIDVVQRTFHMDSAVQFSTQTAHIEVVLHERQHHIGMHVIEFEVDRVVIRLHPVTGYDAYPTTCRQGKLQTGIRLRVVEIQTGYRQGDIFQFPLFMRHYVAVSDRTVVDTDIVQEHLPRARRRVSRHGIRTGEALDDVREVQSVITLEHLTVKAIQVDCTDLDAFRHQLRISDVHVQTFKRDEVRLAVLLLALEALDTHAPPIRVDDHLIRVQLSSYDVLAVVIHYVFGYRRGDRQYQCKEEHYC